MSEWLADEVARLTATVAALSERVTQLTVWLLAAHAPIEPVPNWARAVSRHKTLLTTHVCDAFSAATRADADKLLAATQPRVGGVTVPARLTDPDTATPAGLVPELCVAALSEGNNWQIRSALPDTLRCVVTTLACRGLQLASARVWYKRDTPGSPVLNALLFSAPALALAVLQTRVVDGVVTNAPDAHPLLPERSVLLTALRVNDPPLDVIQQLLSMATHDDHLNVGRPVPLPVSVRAERGGGGGGRSPGTFTTLPVMVPGMQCPLPHHNQWCATWVSSFPLHTAVLAALQVEPRPQRDPRGEAADEQRERAATRLAVARAVLAHAYDDGSGVDVHAPLSVVQHLQSTNTAVHERPVLHAVPLHKFLTIASVSARELMAPPSRSAPRPTQAPAVTAAESLRIAELLLADVQALEARRAHYAAAIDETLRLALCDATAAVADVRELRALIAQFVLVPPPSPSLPAPAPVPA